MEGSENFGAPKSLGAHDLDSDVLGEGIERIKGSHFVQAVLGSIDHHPIVQTNHRTAAGGCADPREGGVDEARETPSPHRETETRGVHRMLGVSLADGSRMLLKSSHQSHERPLPDMNSLIRGNIQLVGPLHIKGRVPGIDVANDPIHTEFRGAMDVRHDLIAQGFFAIQRSEGLGPP